MNTNGLKLRFGLLPWFLRWGLVLLLAAVQIGLVSPKGYAEEADFLPSFLERTIGTFGLLAFSDEESSEHSHEHSHDHSSHGHGASHAEDEHESFGKAVAKIGYSFLGAVALTAGTAPWWGPPVVIDDEGLVSARFLKYPYANGFNGFAVLEDDHSARGKHPVRTYAVQSRVDYGTSFEDVERLSVGLHLETTNRLGLDAEWSRTYVKPGALPSSQDYQVGDLNFIYRFAQSKHAQWWSGGGISWFEQNGHTDIGYNFTYGADIFVGDPFVLSGQMDAGEIHDEAYWHGRITLGATSHRVEFFTGAEFTSFRKNRDVMKIFGLRAWF